MSADLDVETYRFVQETVPVDSPTPDTSTRGRLRATLRPSSLVLPAVLVAGLALWIYSLGRIDLAKLSDYGLAPALPPSWYAALATLVIGAAATVCTPRHRLLLLVAFTAALTFVLFGTVPLISHVPHFEWVYKHIGVTRYIEANGSVDKNIDIYQRWPGFFALAAMFASLAGRPDPTAFVPWAEVFFVFLSAVLIAGVGGRLLRDRRLGWTAGLMFVLTNWIGQSYFSPQAFAFVLALGVYLVVVDRLAVSRTGWVQRLAVGIAARIVRRPVAPIAIMGSDGTSPRSSAASTRGSRAAVICLLIAVDFVIVASHQLTPYMLIVGVTALMVLGIVRPRWLPVLFGIVAVAYLLPNLAYIQRNFGLFNGNPVSNTSTAASFTGTPLPGKVFNAQASQYLTYLVWLLAMVGAVRWLRRGDGTALVPVVLLASSGGLLLGQSYGGEGILRVILFSLPWSCILAVRAFAPAHGRWSMRRLPAVAVILAVLAALFVPAYFGQEEMNILPADEVAAANYLAGHGQPGTSVMAAANGFPGRNSANYNVFPPTETSPTLLALPAFQNKQLGPADVADVVRAMRQYGPNGYLIFATSMYTYARIYQLDPPGSLRNLERAVASSTSFRVWYTDSDTRIYQLVSTAP